MRNGLTIGLVTLLLTAPTSLWAIPIGYDIGPYSTSGYSASWGHSARGCAGPSDLDLNSDGHNDTLYMCAGPRGRLIPLTGMLWGDWDGTILSNITGMLNSKAVTGGSLGGAYYTADMNPLWYLDVTDVGRFYFENINSTINQITDNYLLLWGQNTAAYLGNDRRRWGMDLYGTAKPLSLPEPATLLLMALGLVSLTVVSRQRRQLSTIK